MSARPGVALHQRRTLALVSTCPVPLLLSTTSRRSSVESGASGVHLDNETIDRPTPKLSEHVEERLVAPLLNENPRTYRLDNKGRLKMPDAVARLGWSSGILGPTVSGEWLTMSLTVPSVHRR